VCLCRACFSNLHMFDPTIPLERLLRYNDKEVPYDIEGLIPGLNVYLVLDFHSPAIKLSGNMPVAILVVIRGFSNYMWLGPDSV
jgi:hypothetical protein